MCRLIQSFETISSVYAQQLNGTQSFKFPSITLVTQLVRSLENGCGPLFPGVYEITRLYLSILLKRSISSLAVSYGNIA